jgi:predicted RNA-binding protein with PUA-like domain
MNYWLMKSEPDTFSIDDLKKKKRAQWDGVRSYAARKFMRAQKKGDLAFFYHSSCPEPGIAGLMEIAKAAYPDPADEKWDIVDVAYQKSAKSVLPLSLLKSDSHTKDMAFIRWNRLSVAPVTEKEAKYILSLKALW